MLRLRPAEQRDWARLLCWLNDPETRARFKQSDVVTAKEHFEWLAETLKAVDKRLYVADDHEAGYSVGTVRLDLVKYRKGDDWAEVSVTVEPRARGKGYGGALVQAVVDLGGVWSTPTNEPSGLVAGLVATIKHDNYASLRAFASAGFTPVKVTDKFVTLERVI